MSGKRSDHKRVLRINPMKKNISQYESLCHLAGAKIVTKTRKEVEAWIQKTTRTIPQILDQTKTKITYLECETCGLPCAAEKKVESDTKENGRKR